MAWSTSDHLKAYATDGFLSIYSEDGATEYGLDTLFLLKGESYTLTFTLRKVEGYYGPGPDDLDLTIYSSSGTISSASYSIGIAAGSVYTRTFTPNQNITYIKFGITSSAGDASRWFVWDVSCRTTITR
jgi:hypothetical protein